MSAHSTILVLKKTTGMTMHYSSCLKALFIQRVEILSTTTKSKKIEVKGGFYNEDDMKSELGYAPYFGILFHRNV